jgi:steroid delta-isomerase-like uncharacterized protein
MTATRAMRTLTADGVCDLYRKGSAIMSEQNKATIRRAVDVVWNRGDFSGLAEFMSQDFVVHTSTMGGDIHGPEGVCQYFGALRAAFPDMHFTVEDQIAEGDRVVTRWVAQGTHSGAFQGIAPTGRKCVVSGIDIDRFVDGRAVECWTRIDELGMLQQIGALPEPQMVG